MDQARILVIDDDPLILKLLKVTIEKGGYSVLTAEDGEQGLEVIRGERPDLVISDIMMPRVDGFELIRRLRADRLIANTPLMMLSAKGEEEDKVKGLELGADDYLTKPFSPRELMARVNALLRRRTEVRIQVQAPAEGPFAVEGLVHLREYRFDNFVVGAGNRSAFEAARGAAESPGQRFNPLFIYGGPGLGKTHLMCAMANEVHVRQPSAVIKYVSSEVFSQQILDAHEQRGVEELRRAYAKLDLLLIDDIQFLAISPSLQMVVADILYDLHERGKQILITSDRRPEALETLTSEITSGFAYGLVVEIDRPDKTLRANILRFKARQKGWDLSEEILDYLAQCLDTDVRSMEGAAQKLAAIKAFGGGRITRETVDQVVMAILRSEAAEPLPARPRREPCEALTTALEKQHEAASDDLGREFSAAASVIRIVGTPEEVALAMPPSSTPVVILGPSASLVVDAAEALVGRHDQPPRIPEGQRWAYLLHVEGHASQWVVVGTTTWDATDPLARAIGRAASPTFMLVLDSMSPKIMEARRLVSNLRSGVNAIVVVLVSVSEDELQTARESLSKSLRRLFRVPDETPLVVCGSVTTAQTRAWLRMARR